MEKSRKNAPTVTPEKDKVYLDVIHIMWGMAFVNLVIFVLTIFTSLNVGMNRTDVRNIQTMILENRNIINDYNVRVRALKEQVELLEKKIEEKQLTNPK
jgi:hypothetical protein